MKLKDFIKTFKKDIDQYILSSCNNLKLNNKERELWIRNDQYLYNLAKDAGVKL